MTLKICNVQFNTKYDSLPQKKIALTETTYMPVLIVIEFILIISFRNLCPSEASSLDSIGLAEPTN